MAEDDIFQRTELLVGSEVMTQLASVNVIIFGVGGVGSWCAEALVRSGIRRLTIVDSDCVAASNVNRQLMATTKTIGLPKVEVLRERLLDINPAASVDAVQNIYTKDTAADFCLDKYDYIIDAIDSLEHKANLIRHACKTDAVLYSSMGAALKMNPLKIDVAEFWKVRGCPLAAALRRKFKKQGELPARKFRCVYSEELLENRTPAACMPAEGGAADNPEFHKVQTNGTVVHAVATFGLMLAGLVVQDLYDKYGDDCA
ncbi:MAG: tRNA threonylcarbamoyladenosine dehydratase [Bacteroides sp.]|nr:tRNA threonylcarbamoyladenosine dehydratase [Roseburia sp.]MCM1346895.1 tRNA threonylcarbamoyladenosine dehydratase [Bacteroides sp.]MCM1420626.1 tRNA threonylcarbamoyladenosine dehydratase [Bacteroides sp.]